LNFRIRFESAASTVASALGVVFQEVVHLV
jgi:hypothetical protein